jgi:hypothetical protein
MVRDNQLAARKAICVSGNLFENGARIALCEVGAVRSTLPCCPLTAGIGRCVSAF